MCYNIDAKKGSICQSGQHPMILKFWNIFENTNFACVYRRAHDEDNDSLMSSDIIVSFSFCWTNEWCVDLRCMNICCIRAVYFEAGFELVEFFS